MPFANLKLPEAALSKAQKADLAHRTTDLLVDYFGEGGTGTYDGADRGGAGWRLYPRR